MVKMHHNIAKQQVLAVYLGEQVFGIPITKVQDVLDSFQLTRVPIAPPYIAGVANLRGRIVTAIDLRKRINDASPSGESSMNVVLELNSELYSILVDRVGDVLTVEDNALEEPPVTLKQELKQVMHSVYQLSGSIMIVLHVDRIIYAN